jgi:hypothetical protein
MAEQICYTGRYTIVGLERAMRNDEALGLSLTAIAADAGATVGTYEENSTKDYSLVVWVDPSGTSTGPAGATLICRGKATIQGNVQDVAAFRKA